jgi:hypothetical protein
LNPPFSIFPFAIYHFLQAALSNVFAERRLEAKTLLRSKPASANRAVMLQNET